MKNKKTLAERDSTIYVVNCTSCLYPDTVNCDSYGCKN